MFDVGTQILDGCPVGASPQPWLDVHEQLVAIRKQRTALDARELGLLLEADHGALHRKLGYPTMVAYMMTELDCSRHTANEKLRVAHELIDLPLIDQAMHTGALSWTKVRELTRVATAETEEDWLEMAEGKDSAQVQQLVKGYAKGARPSDRPDPALVKEWIGMELTGPMAGRWRQMRVALDAEAGRHLTDDELVDAVVKRVMTPAEETDKPSRPAYSIALTTCTTCKRAHEVGPGVENEISASAVERALCDAVFVGDLEDETPTPAKWSIPAPTRRKVFIRDKYACAVPGCTSKRFLEMHHVVPREHGGGNEIWNVLLLCNGCHTLCHEGLIVISGRAPDDLVFERGPAGTHLRRQLVPD